MCSLHKFILSVCPVSGVAREARQRSLARKCLSHCLLATLPKPEAAAGMFGCLMPGLGRIRKVLWTLVYCLVPYQLSVWQPGGARGWLGLDRRHRRLRLHDLKEQTFVLNWRSG